MNSTFTWVRLDDSSWWRSCHHCARLPKFERTRDGLSFGVFCTKQAAALGSPEARLELIDRGHGLWQWAFVLFACVMGATMIAIGSDDPDYSYAYTGVILGLVAVGINACVWSVREHRITWDEDEAGAES